MGRSPSCGAGAGNTAWRSPGATRSLGSLWAVVDGFVLFPGNSRYFQGFTGICGRFWAVVDDFRYFCPFAWELCRFVRVTITLFLPKTSRRSPQNVWLMWTKCCFFVLLGDRGGEGNRVTGWLLSLLGDRAGEVMVTGGDPGWAGLPAACRGGSFAAGPLMPAKTSDGKNEKQIPFGDDNQRNNGSGEIQGSLRCATDGEAVRRFGRDDVVVLEERSRCARCPP
jgi:hypothetical protein